METAVKSLAIVVVLLLASLATTARAEAATAEWSVYPGLDYSGLFEYGWHFDE